MFAARRCVIKLRSTFFIASDEGKELRARTSIIALLLVCIGACAQEPRIPRQTQPRIGTIQGLVHRRDGRAIPGVSVLARNQVTGEVRTVSTDADGIFRLLRLPAGQYVLQAGREGFTTFQSAAVALSPGQLETVAITLDEISPTTPPANVTPTPLPPSPTGAPYHELPRGEAPPEATATLPPAGTTTIPRSDRWDIPVPPRPSKKKTRAQRWYNPFDRNVLKGDYPIIGQQTFLDITLITDTLFESRRVPTPSDVSQARPGDPSFFGRGGQFFYPQLFRFSFDLFHGDTAYKPVDWRIRITPAANFNYTHTQENGIINIDPRKGTNRLDGFLGLQEAFAEKKLADLSPNYDFISVRAGIQGFNDDFRGFLFIDEQPGVRLFGNLHSNRWEYNGAYFNLLEKDTNSQLNTLQRRNQQVALANFYMQDFVWPGYTTQFSFTFNKDDADIHYNTNDFLVRPSPVGAVQPHQVETEYLGWTGNGHIHRLNISHAFYQALGHDTLNPIAGRPVRINAQFAAVELSVDKDWLRFRTSGMFASGDRDPRNGTGRGFDAIVDQPNFAGGIFSVWDREAIRLTGTGVNLVQQDSFLPNLRPDKTEGQANFVNPGIFLFNVGVDAELTTKLRAISNANLMRFHRTEPLELLLFQQPIHAGIGADYSLGLQYRPLLSDNIVLTGGASVLAPFQGFRDIYFDHAVFSMFTNVRFKF